jgi:hypothetical protein
MIKEAEPILDPTGGRELADHAVLAPRAGTLRGATIGLLSSSKHNSDALLAELGQLLQERCGAGELVADTKPHFGAPVADDQIARLGARCDAVVTAIGD